jgi:hypothetical protein
VNLQEHAEFELRRAGLFDKDSDYDGMLGPAVLALIKVFSEQGHSGFSAAMVRELFGKLAAFKTLTPITADPSEWMDVCDAVPDSTPGVWQNRRQSSCFSYDGGKTYYDIDAGDDRAIKESAPSVIRVQVKDGLTVTTRPA